MTATQRTLLKPPPPASLRATAGAGIELPSGSLEDALVGVPWDYRDSKVSNATGAVRAAAGAVIRRAARMGVLIGAPTRMLAALQVGPLSNHPDTLVIVTAGEIRAAAVLLAPSSLADRFVALADVLGDAAVAAEVRTIQHQPRLSWDRAVEHAGIAAKGHAVLDTLCTAEEEDREVIYNDRQGAFHIAVRFRGGKTFEEYTHANGSTLRVEAKKTYGYYRV